MIMSGPFGTDLIARGPAAAIKPQTADFSGFQTVSSDAQLIALGADDAEWTNFDAVGKVCLWVNQGLRVDHDSAFRSAHKICALAASSPSTSARASYSPMPRRIRIWSTSRIS